MSGWWSIRLRNACRVRTKKRRGVAAVTVAVRRGESQMSAISPKKSPALSRRSSRLLRHGNLAVDDDEELGPEVALAGEDLALLDLEVLRDLGQLDQLAA
jgi:hypothetical protein